MEDERICCDWGRYGWSAMRIQTVLRQSGYNRSRSWVYGILSYYGISLKAYRNGLTKEARAMAQLQKRLRSVA